MTELISWLLEEENPGLRYLALRDLKAAQANPETLAKARREAHQVGKIPAILAKMDLEGYWAKPGAGYSPKYQSSVWALILLAQLGARKEEDERIAKAMDYYRQHAFIDFGRINCSDSRPQTFDCLQRNMVWALLRLGMPQTELTEQIDWLASSQTGAGIALASNKLTEKSYVIDKSGAVFDCTHNGEQPCAWGAIRVLIALGQVPEVERTEKKTESHQLGGRFPTAG